MSLKTIVDLIEPIENGCIQVRTCIRTTEDKNVFHRHVVAPGDDYSAEDAKVQAVCAALHTPEVISAYQASFNSQGV